MKRFPSKKVYLLLSTILLTFMVYQGCELFEEDEPESKPPEPANIGFWQLDWYGNGDVLVLPNSQWGYLSWTYIPDETKTYYLNVVVQKSGSRNFPVWIVENLPLFSTSHDENPIVHEGVYFNIEEMGLYPGERLSQLTYAYSVTEDIMTVDPGPPSQTAEVGKLDWFPRNYQMECPVEDPFEGPKVPVNIKLSGKAAKENELRNMSSVQEGDAKCCTGSFARSIDWLNRKHKLGVDKNAQQFYNDLIGENVGKPGQGGPNSRDEWVENKDKYCDKTFGENKIETKIWEMTAETVDPTEGVTQTTGDFMEWLKAEINDGEDVEIAYYYPENAHIVAVAQLYTKDDEVFVKYRDDEYQGDDAKGDTDVKNAKIYKKADGNYRFGSDQNVIYFAVSESVK